MTTYKIVRKYFNEEDELVATGLTLEEAQEHCQDPETSGSTCADFSKRGLWFDSYDEEE